MQYIRWHLGGAGGQRGTPWAYPGRRRASAGGSGLPGLARRAGQPGRGSPAAARPARPGQHRGSAVMQAGTAAAGSRNRLAALGLRARKARSPARAQSRRFHPEGWCQGELAGQGLRRCRAAAGALQGGSRGRRTPASLECSCLPPSRQSGQCLGGNRKEQGAQGGGAQAPQY